MLYCCSHVTMINGGVSVWVRAVACLSSYIAPRSRRSEDETRETNVNEEPAVIALEPADWSFDSSTGRGRFSAERAGGRVRRGQLLRLEPRGQEPVLARATVTRNGMVMVKRVGPEPTSTTDAKATATSPSADEDGQDAPRREPMPARVEQHASDPVDLESTGDGSGTEHSPGATTHDAVDSAGAAAAGSDDPAGSSSDRPRGASSVPAPGHAPVELTTGGMDGSGTQRSECEHVVSSQHVEPARKPILEAAVWKLARGARLGVRALADGGASVADRLAHGSRRVRRGVKSAAQRLDRGWADEDAWNLGYVTLVQLSGMMAWLAASGHGYPAGYDEDRSKWLVRHEGEDYEKWLRSPARVVDRISADMDAGVCDLDKAFNETVGEYGVGASAWMQDLDHASRVLKEYAEASYDVERWSGDVDVYGREEADRRSKALEDEFQRTWAWIGVWLASMWD